VCLQTVLNVSIFHAFCHSSLPKLFCSGAICSTRSFSMPIKSASAALIPLFVAAFLLSGCQDEQAAAPAAAEQTPQVGIVTLKAEPFALTTELPGRTTAFRVAEVRPQVNGIIQKRLFNEGSEVKKGQQLYQIDPAVY